jgi:cation:H+ antiporter
VVIGVLLGLGTSLPEMTIAMKSMRRGADGLILGNLMGSNILDPLMAIGGGALIAPLTIDRKVLFFEFPFLIVGTLMALLLLRERDDLDRYEGISLILFYLLFLFMSIFTFAFA